MNDNIRVSICIPVYNSGKYIESTLNSIINQTHKYLEILVSDNASTDNTEANIKNIMKNDGRIKYFRNDKNIGYVNNITSLVNKASSEFIAIYHGDDIYEIDIVEKELNVLLKSPEIACVFGKFREFSGFNPDENSLPYYDKNLHQSDLLDKAKNIISGNLTDYLTFIMRVGNIFGCPSLMIRKGIYFETGGFSDRYQSNEDLDLWLRILLKGYRIAIINETLFKYRRSRESGSAYWERRPELPVFFRVIDDFLANNNIKIDNETYKIYMMNKADGFLVGSYNAFFQGDFIKFNDNLILSKETFKFPILSKKGIIQRYPVFGFMIKKLVRKLKNKQW